MSVRPGRSAREAQPDHPRRALGPQARDPGRHVLRGTDVLDRGGGQGLVAERDEDIVAPALRIAGENCVEIGPPVRRVIRAGSGAVGDLRHQLCLAQRFGRDLRRVPVDGQRAADVKGVLPREHYGGPLGSGLETRDKGRGDFQGLSPAPGGRQDAQHQDTYENAHVTILVGAAACCP